MKNQLSKREYKYRCKIIAENHLKKDCQMYLDNHMGIAVLGNLKIFTYKNIYLNKHLLNTILAGYSFKKLCESFNNFGLSVELATDSFGNLTQSLKTWLEDDIDE